MKNESIIENSISSIDKEFIKSIADELVDETWRFFTDAQALQSFTDHYKIMVDDFDELKKIKSAYPKLGDSLKILKMDSNGTWPVCIETGGKNCNISIPIENPVLNISFFNKEFKTEDFPTPDLPYAPILIFFSLSLKSC